MITALVRPDAKSAEPLRVVLRAVAAYQEQTQKNPAGPGISQAQREWLRSGLDFAAYTLFPSEGGRHQTKDESPAAIRRRRVAYRALQNGFTTNEPGSAYDRVNAFLELARGKELQQTRKRNVRAAAGASGRVRNAMTSGIGDSTQWRKSALKQLSKAATATGLLPTRAEALAALNQTAFDAREALSERHYKAARAGKGDLAPAEKLLLGVLEAADLGAWPPHDIDVKKLKHLKADFFDKAEARLGPEGLNSMDAAFRKEWMQLRTSHPNVGHLFCRLCRKVDMRRIVHPGSTDAPPRSLRERGELWDKRADVAIEAFANLAQVCRSATGGPDARGPAAALAALAEMTAVELKKVSPKAALGALRIDIFENVENALALHQFHTLPKENRSSFQEVRRIVRDSWPSSVRADWDEMKVSGVDVSRLLRNLTDAISRLLGDLPTRNTPSAAASAAEGAAEAKPERIMNCVEAAGVALNALHRDTQVNRFELALCDTITVFNDVRGPTDAAAVLRSLSHRVSLGEKLKATDQQQRGLDVGKIISLPIQFISGMPLTLGLGASIGVETSMDIAMNGAAVQMYLGKGTTRGFNVRAGLGITNVKALPLGPMSLFQAGPRFDVIRADMQQEWARLEGVTLRHIRTSGHEDQLRRSFGDILIDLMDPEAIKTEDGQQYPDRLAALLDRNEFLSVAELVNTRRTSGGELSVGLGGFVGRSMGVGGQSAPYGGLASIGVGLKTQAADMRQVESAAQLSIQEHRLARVSRLELKRGAALPSIIRMTPHTSTFVRAGTFQTRRELLQNGAESLLRIVTKNGETWDTVSHFIQEHELLEDFLESVAGYMHQFCRSAIAKDDVHGAPVGERLGRAWNRISELLDATSKAQRPVDTYTRSLRMRSETAHARDRLEALAEIASDAGMRKEAAEIRASVDELLSHGDAWTAMNMQVRTKGRDEVAQSVMLNIFAGKAVGEATRLHEFLPLGAQNVGRTPNMPVPAPRDDLPPWSPSRQALPSPFTRKEWTERAEDMKQRLQNVQARTTEAEAEKKLLQKQMLTTELAIDGRLKRVRKQRMEVEAAMREELQIAAAVAGDREHPGQLRKASQKLDDAFVKLSRKGSTYAGKLKRFKDLDELVVRLKREEESLTKDISDVLWKAKGAPVRKLPESTTIDQGARAKNAVRMASQGSTGSEVAEKVPFSIPPQSDMEKCGAEEARSTTHDLTEAERVRKGRTSKEAKDSLMKLPTSLPPPPRSGTRRFGAWFESKAHTLSGKLAGFGGASRTTERPARIRKEASTPSELAIEGDPSVTAHGRRQELKSRHRQWKDQTVAATEARRAAAAPIDAHAPEDGNATVEKLAADLNDISRLFERQHGLFDQSGDQMGMEKLIACIPLLSPQPRLKMQTLSGGPLKKRSPKELKGPVVAKHEELAKDLQGRLDKVERLHRELEELSRDFNNGLREIPEVGQVDSAVARLRLKRIKADLEELENSAKQKTSLNDVQGIAAAAVLAFVKHKHVELLRRELDQQAEIIKYAKDNGIRRLDDVQPAFARLKEALGKLKELEMASKESSVAYKELVRRLKGPVETLEDANEWSMSAIRTMAQLVKDPDLMAKLPLLTAQEELAETVSLLTDALMEAERGMRSAENGATKSRKMIDALEMDISWKRGGRL
ncbi:MAG TPA: hypothetical protein VFP68_22835 [Burkholderiaceae bacterium]|nr:hypothetical protein [Burkholderiaceae bacterium]